MSRQFVWPDPTVQKLAKHFVPVAEHVERISNAKGPALAFVRKMLAGAPDELRQEHTFQGTYVVTPDGRFLAGKFGEEKHPRHGLASTTEILRTGWKAWQAHAAKHGIRSRPVPSPKAPPKADGLRLQVHVRDLPRKRSSSGDDDIATAHSVRWNLKWIVLSHEQAATLVPARGKAQVPAATFKALVRDVTVDYVYDQGHDGWWADDAVKRATLTSEVLRTEGQRVTVRLTGELVMQQGQQFGYEGKWLGEAVYDRGTKRFVSFQLAATGMRMTSRKLAHWVRQQDKGGLTAPMGLAYSLPERKR